MEHPGIDFQKEKDDLSLDQVQEKIRDISFKLSFAFQSGNQGLIGQLRMALETYERIQTEKLDEMFNSNTNETQGKIDIS